MVGSFPEVFMDDCTCLRCDFTWRPRVQDPKCCPHCKSRIWNKPKGQERRPGRPPSQLAIAVAHLEVGQSLENQELMAGRDSVACVQWVRAAIRAANNAGYTLAAELISGRPPKVTRSV
jgi:hypothetical protein